MYQIKINHEIFGKTTYDNVKSYSFDEKFLTIYELYGITTIIKLDKVLVINITYKE